MNNKRKLNINIQEDDFYGDFIKNSPEGICITDENGVIVIWNDKLSEYTGISAKDSIGENIKTIQRKLNSIKVGKALPMSIIEEKLDNLLVSGKNVGINEKQIISLQIPGQNIKYIEKKIFTIKAKKGYRIAMTVSDKTKEIITQNNIQLYKYIFKNNKDGIGILNNHYVFIESNQSLSETIGYSKEKIAGKTPGMFLPENVFFEIIKVYEYQDHFEGELKSIRDDGTELYIEMSMFPVKIQDISFCHIILVRDIDIRKKSEKELLEAKTKAEESDRLKTAFLSNMSHEIRTPMNSILGFSGLLEKPNLPEEKRSRYVNFINKNGEGLLHLIDDIIDISKIESNQLKITKKECDLKGLVDEIHSSMIKVAARDKREDLQIVKKTPTESVFIRTDPYRLKQILNNLIFNAIKFTEKGIVEFGFQINNNEILFHVKDTGIGISDQMKKQIFERFRKSEKSKNKLYRGAGLGLAISKQLVELMGGKIWVESYLDKGSIFYFTTPYVQADFKGSVVSFKYSFLDQRWPGKKILVVEDNANSFELIKEYLGDTETEIIHAKSGNEAVKIYSETKKISLVLMDIQLPGMNGIEATKLIKALNPSAIIIAQTAYAMQEEKENALDSGCSDFLTKPVKKDSFFELLNKYLS